MSDTAYLWEKAERRDEMRRSKQLRILYWQETFQEEEGRLGRGYALTCEYDEISITKLR